MSQRSRLPTSSSGCQGRKRKDAGLPPQPPADLDAGLYVVATPIGNLADITLRALQTLAGADVIVCEDTRVTARLLAAHGIERPLLSYHEHNAARRRPEIVARIDSGAAVALVCDAGTPLVSDPGYKLVRAVQDAGRPVTPMPGPSAAMAALVAAGLPSDRFFFQGFLPAKSKARRGVLAGLKDLKASLIVYESPRRLRASLLDMAAVLGPREAVVARELTKRFEDVRRACLTTLAEVYAKPPRGEVVVVVAPPSGEAARIADAEVDARLRAALAEASMRDAVDAVARDSGRPRREIYARAVAIKAETAE